MKIIFLCGLYPEEYNEEVINNSKRGIQFAANNLQWAFVEGLDEYYDDVSIITAPFISSFPLGYKKLFIKKSMFSHNNISNDVSVGYINLPIINDIQKIEKLKKEIKKKILNYKGKKYIIIYSLQSSLLQIATDIKKSFPGVKICQIVPDLPEHMNANKIYKMLGMKRRAVQTIRRLTGEIDSFVLLSDNMKKRLNISGKPWVRIEGIYKSDHSETEEKETNKTILYTGSLSSRYGISNLLSAFAMIDSSDYRLWICGDGDMREQIIEQSKEDGRIQYFGLLPFEEIKILQRRATVLINPRTSEGEYTKYSFPSKTMEYLASGTPAIMYPLPGIPQEYLKFIFIPDDEGIDNLYKTILEVCSKPQGELNNFGAIARDFILTNKNPKAQVNKIVKMLNNL